MAITSQECNQIHPIMNKVKKVNKATAKVSYVPRTIEAIFLLIEILILSRRLFQCLTKYLAPALRVVANGMEPHSNSSTDGYRYLKTTMIKRCKNGKRLSSRGTKEPTFSQLETAMKGRNALCHCDLPVILEEWDSFLSDACVD